MSRFADARMRVGMAKLIAGCDGLDPLLEYDAKFALYGVKVIS